MKTGVVQGGPARPKALLDDEGNLFTRLRPQYENLGPGDFLIATENGCNNDGSGDNTAAINAFLKNANDAGKVAYFSRGIYKVQGTILSLPGPEYRGPDGRRSRRQATTLAT